MNCCRISAINSSISHCNVIFVDEDCSIRNHKTAVSTEVGIFEQARGPEGL